MVVAPLVVSRAGLKLPPAVQQFWPWRLAVLGGLSLFYLLATAAAWRLLSKRLGRQSAPFSGSIAEMKKDKEWLDSPS